MANKKAVSTAKKSTAKTTTAVKNTVKSASTKVVAVSTTDATSSMIGDMPSDKLVRIVLAEIIGTFILTMAALISFSDNGSGAISVGLTLMVIVLGIGAVSGAHVNPAVTFGLWSMRKLKTALVPFYWVAQFIGAMAAVLLINSVAKDTIAFSFDHFTSFNWGLFTMELVGMAVFMFGIAAAISRKGLATIGTALGVGIALTVGILVSGNLLANIQSAAIKAYQAETATANGKTVDIPATAYVKGATLNPAIALASTEKTTSQLTGQTATTTEKQYTRFSLEVIFATLIGAALGGNLYLLLSNRSEDNE